MLSEQQIHPGFCPWFYLLGLAPGTEELWDILCSAEPLGTNGRGRNYRAGIKWGRMGLGFWETIPPWEGREALE